ncbi:putative LRR receptor-like serine/threonine-protein kinase [Morus notabilis]|uniref:Putative LRR receptor-like serine/threonine-protein kinase n=1 Tax=Morus notabilis TaxID=981085 RepID=W9QZM6_9ROSA|nr:putative LRR receptor-like serine/threonine-protein kinase [Morus notabilis]
MNRLEGNIPQNLFHPNLEVFFIHFNKFGGQVPLISNATKLINFEIGNNHFTGKVPDFPSLPHLRSIGLNRNNLGHQKNGDLNFMSSVVNCTNLELFGIEDNNFGGTLPECMCNFSTKLSYVTMGRNQIKGRIPTRIENLVNLQLLGIETNQLVGPIPGSIGKLQKLFGLNFHNNKLSGAIPSSLGNLTSLGELILKSNNLQGRIPSSLGKCKYLVALTLSQNNLTGPIPKEVISLSSLSRFLDLSRNYFTGSIPNEVGKLSNLGYLDISENRLSGKIPNTLGSCESMEYLNLQGNLLQENIPQSFYFLKGIQEIDLSRNNLSGEIPKYLEGEVPTQGVFTNTSAFSAVGNTRLCGGRPQLNLPKCPSSLNKKAKLSTKHKLIVSVVCGLVAIILLALFSVLLSRARKRNAKSTLGSPFGISFLEVSYGDLLKATDGFSSANLIGAGSFGSVYKGILNQEKTLDVAVKVLNLQTSRALKSFIAECKVLKNIKHRNLLKLLTACSSIDFQGNDFKALVYEFMVNASLDEWLHPRQGLNSEEERHLNLIQRINIAIDVANALDYLHRHCHEPIVHSDLKPSNILLDGDMTARVGDFGLARFLMDPSHLFSSHQSSSIGIRGSIGYIAPEYVMGGEISRDGDVYSYGILLLEMFTGKRPTDEMFKDDFNLHNFVKMSLPEKLAHVVDSSLLIGTDQVEEGAATTSDVGDREIDHIEEISINNFQNVPNCRLILNTNLGKCLHSVLKIGISCSKLTSTERMNMGDVVKELLHVKTAYMAAQTENRGDQ